MTLAPRHLLKYLYIYLYSKQKLLAQYKKNVDHVQVDCGRVKVEQLLPDDPPLMASALYASGRLRDYIEEAVHHLWAFCVCFHFLINVLKQSYF